MHDESLLIGETVLYNSNQYGERKGVVMGVGVIKNRETDVFPTTAYSIVSESKEIEHVPYHQIKGIVEPDITLLELLDKEGDLINISFPKYSKPPHLKGWNVEGEGNNDLPFS